MRELFQRGATVVMVQHNMEAILQMCHRVMWLNKGKIETIGDSFEVVEKYLQSQGQPMVDVPRSIAPVRASGPAGGAQHGEAS